MLIFYGIICLLDGDWMLKSKKKRTLDEYINIAKWDIILYLILIAFFGVPGIVFILFDDFLGYFFIFLAFLIFIGIFGRIAAFSNLDSINKYITENNLIDKIGDIDYWNEYNYFLTENFMIIKYNGIVYHFKYKDILKIFYEEYVYIGKNSKSKTYLHIVVEGFEEFKILINSSSLVYEDTKDISDYLLDKDPNIIFDEKVSSTNIRVLSIKND